MTIAKALMIVRDEAEILKACLGHHLDLGFDEIHVLDHCSVDATGALLTELASDRRLQVHKEHRSDFDHEAYANLLLEKALEGGSVDWIFLLDADEFLVLSKPLKPFLDDLDAQDIRYGTIKWLNAVPGPDASHGHAPSFGEWFFEPWPERPWQDEGHLRKAFCRVHAGMSIVVGGHYFRREANPTFFTGRHWSPHLVPLCDARLYHFEQRLTPRALLEKWERLSAHTVEPGYDPAAPWNEKVVRMRGYLERYGGDLQALERDWFEASRTFWGSGIPADRLVRDGCLLERLGGDKRQSTPCR